MLFLAVEEMETWDIRSIPTESLSFYIVSDKGCYSLSEIEWLEKWVWVSQRSYPLNFSLLHNIPSCRWNSDLEREFESLRDFLSDACYSLFSLKWRPVTWVRVSRRGYSFLLSLIHVIPRDHRNSKQDVCSVAKGAYPLLFLSWLLTIFSRRRNSDIGCEC